MGKTYKIRKFRNGRNKSDESFYTNYSLTIPSSIAEKLPEDMLFECVLTDDGILFRPATEEEQKIELPAWAKSNGSSKKRSRPRKEKQQEAVA